MYTGAMIKRACLLFCLSAFLGGCSTSNNAYQDEGSATTFATDEEHYRWLLPLLEQPYSRELIEHHQNLLSQEATTVIATELLILRHGPGVDEPAISYLSSFTETSEGIRHHERAQQLGRWLGALRVALESEPVDPETGSDLLREVLEAMTAEGPDMVTSSPQRMLDGDLPGDVLDQHLTLATAFELLAYSEIVVSDVENVINNAIEAAS